GCDMPRAWSLRRRRRTVPSTPEIAREDMYAGMSGDCQATCSISAKPFAVMRAVRDRPAPLSMCQPRVSTPWLCNTDSAACAPEAGVAPGPEVSAPNVNKRWRAMTLLLRLLITRMVSAKVSESVQTRGCALAGALPSRSEEHT